MTARERALKEFRKRWKKDAESDGEELPISQQLENAWKLGWEAMGKELKEWLDESAKDADIPDREPAPSIGGVLRNVITKCDDLMKEKS